MNHRAIERHEKYFIIQKKINPPLFLIEIYVFVIRDGAMDTSTTLFFSRKKKYIPHERKMQLDLIPQQCDVPFTFVRVMVFDYEYMKCNYCLKFFGRNIITMWRLTFAESMARHCSALMNKSPYPIPRYIFGCGSMVIIEDATVCYNCKELLCCGGDTNLIVYKYDFDEEERIHCANVRHCRKIDGTTNREYLHGIELPNIVQNTPTWMRARFGPDLRRLGASKAGGVLCISPYGGAKSLYEMITGCNNINRWENSSRSTETEFGHFYEEFVRKLVELILPELAIIEGGIRVPCAEKDRLKFAVSVDGDVYYKDEMRKDNPLIGYAGNFEAKCSYHRDHGSQAVLEAIRGKKHYLNEDGVYGIKAEHMAQVQMQMGVTGSPWTIYCTVQWRKYIPPHPQYKIPPFDEIVLLKIPFSNHYWYKYEKPALDKFADSLRGYGNPPTSNFSAVNPPRVKGIENLISDYPHPSTARTRLNRLRAGMFHYVVENERKSVKRGKEIEEKRTNLKSMMDKEIDPSKRKKFENELYDDEWW